MKNINIIQAVIIGVSVVAIAVAIVMFSLFRGGSIGSSIGQTVIWGTIPNSSFQSFLQKLRNDLNLEEVKDIKYVQKDVATIEDELLKAMAEDSAPDLVLLNEKQIIKNQTRLQIIPYKSFPIRDYQDTFFDGADILLSKEGIIGFPFHVDPLVLYYNKNLLLNEGYSRPPQTWAEVLAVAPTLTEKDSSFNIFKSTIALGSFDNIKNAKEIYWMLVLQAGNPVIERYQEQNDPKEKYRIIFDDDLNFTLNPAYAATNFFTQFSNPTKTVYSWNRSLQDSQTAFISGDLVFYLGRASEINTIKKLNPNLNFDVALMPQSRSSERKTTYGTMQIFTIPKNAPNLNGAIATIGIMTRAEVQDELVKLIGGTSARTDVLENPDVADPYQVIFNDSSIIAQGILEPDAQAIDGIIKELVDTIVSGQYEISKAIENADEKMSLLLNNE